MQILTIFLVECFCRVHVDELWAKGERVTCGVIADETRVSTSSMTKLVISKVKRYVPM